MTTQQEETFSRFISYLYIPLTTSLTLPTHRKFAHVPTDPKKSILPQREKVLDPAAYTPNSEEQPPSVSVVTLNRQRKEGSSYLKSNPDKLNF